jgi:hypothetical protein
MIAFPTPMKYFLTLFFLLSFLTIAQADVNPFNGLWVASGPREDLTRLSVTREKGEAWIEAWGNLQSADHDWSRSALTCYSTRKNGTVPDRALAAWDNGSAHTVLILKISPDGEHLKVEIFTNFKDDSGRTNHATEVDLVRPKT